MAQQPAAQQPAQAQPLLRSESGSSLGGGDAPRCRLCWGSGGSGDSDAELITPCACKGSMAHIHVGCLRHWLETARAQGRPRSAVARCEVCKTRYRDARLSSSSREHGGPGSGPAPLLPGLLQDPYALAALLHGAWRAYVAVSGLVRAYTIYRSIHAGSARLPAAAAAAPCGPASSSGSGGWRGRRPAAAARPSGADLRVQLQPQQPATTAVTLGQLSLSIPLLGSGGRSSQQQAAAALESVRERFDSATLVQVHWYTALMALTPTPPNADAFAGMAMGATIGGMLAQVIFMPMLGAPTLSAMRHAGALLLRCLLRLMAAEACQPRGFRLLASGVRLLLLLRRRRPVWRRWRPQRPAGVEPPGQPAGAVAAEA